MTGAALPKKERVADASMRARIWQLTSLACGTLVVLGLLLAWSVERNREANVWVVHTQIVQSALAGYMREIVDGETSQRGYLLTLQEPYLAPYKAVLSDNRTRLEHLRGLITDEGEQRKLQRLAQILSDKLFELGQTIQLARAGNRPAALAIVREGRGQRYTVEFRRLGEEIARSEAATLTKRQALAAAEGRNIQIGMALGGLLAILLIVGAAVRTIARIEDRARILMRGILAVAGGNLDRRVETTSPDGVGKVAAAFNDMADRLQAAKQTQERVEADLAKSNLQLHAEIKERGDAQALLLQSVTELRRSNEELDNFAYGASHDLKAPLRGIRNLTEWIAGDVKDNASPDTMENLVLLHSRVDRLDMLLDSLLQYSRIGRTGGEPEDVDICRLIDEIGDYIAPRAGFTVTCGSERLVIRTNRAPLEQVLRNLIGNGLKHNGASTGTVTVSARDLGTMIEIRVEDDGPGIPPIFHERIFQMFQTLKSRDEVEGSGMGLAIAKKSVEGHGGTIRVESGPPHRGTAFVFTWKKDRVALAA
jgi:signal transduction histidine kinase